MSRTLHPGVEMPPPPPCGVSPMATLLSDQKPEWHSCFDVCHIVLPSPFEGISERLRTFIRKL